MRAEGKGGGTGGGVPHRALAFSGCSTLWEVRSPSGVISLGDRIFERCAKLERAELSEGVTEMGARYLKTVQA